MDNAISIGLGPDELGFAAKREIARLDRRLMVPHQRILRVTGGVHVTSSASYADYPTTVELTDFQKHLTNTYLTVRVETTCFVDTAGIVGHFGVRLNGAGTDYDVAQLYFNTALEHTTVVGSREIGSLEAGYYDVRVRWKNAAGANSFQTDTNDIITLTVEETY